MIEVIDCIVLVQKTNLTLDAFADYDTDSITSSERAVIQTPDQSEGATNSTFSSDFGEPEPLPPQPLEIEKAKQDDKKDMVSSYENVYTGVPLDPTVNRMSMDASEMDIGDKFDTKQPESHHQPMGRSSSYEKVYQAEQGVLEGEGECKSESTTASSLASGPITASSVSSSHMSYVSNAHNCPVYITVESGLDKLACDSNSNQAFSAYDGQGVKLKLDVVERSMSCETGSLQEEMEPKKLRHRSSPDMYSPIDDTLISPFDNGTYFTFVITSLSFLSCSLSEFYSLSNGQFARFTAIVVFLSVSGHLCYASYQRSHFILFSIVVLKFH